MRDKIGKFMAAALVMTMLLNNGIYALESQNGDQYSYTVSDDESFIDGTMSNPDGYQGTGYEVETTGDVDVINQSLARGSGYDLTWSIEDGVKVMYDGDGKRFGYGACKKVIDVSSYNGTIDWAAVKSDGIDGAILRITSFAGGSMHEDDRFADNLQGCRENNIPFGVYMYSYADTTSDATNEANYVVSLLKKYNVRPSEMAYSVYYDLEENSSTRNNSLSQNITNVKTFVGIVNNAGYIANVYSYKSWLEEKLNSPEIHQYASWVAQYGYRLTFNNNYYQGNYGWQYRSNGSVAGINGDVDVSCFSNYYGYDSENHTNETLGRDENTPYLEYRANCQNVGWLPYFMEPNTAGTTGRGLPMYQLQFNYNNFNEDSYLSGSITNTKGTYNYDKIDSSTVLGNDGSALRQVVFKINNLIGFHLEYRVHSADIGWQDWVSEGEMAGTINKDIQAIDFRLVEEGDIHTITFDKNNIEMNINENDKIVAAVKPENTAMDKTLTWTSSDSSIVSVDQNGNITSHKAGQATITATAVNGIQATCVVNVIIPITEIVLDQDKLTLEKGNNATLQAKIGPENTTFDKTINWKSENDAVATVDQNGKITAIDAGTTNIIASTSNGISVSCQVTVTSKITSVTLNQTSTVIAIGGTTNLEATIKPDNTTDDKTLIWKSEDASIATVDQTGKVIGKKAGTTYIVVTTSTGISTNCKVTVVKQIPTISYKTHIQDFDWEKNYVSNGKLSGTTGLSKRLEGIKIKIDNNEGYQGTIKYQTHIQDIGWQDWKTDDEISGTTGQSKRLEAIKIELTEDLADNFDIYYRVHVQELGWLDWASNGEAAGTAGYCYRLEAIEIQLVAKGEKAPGTTSKPFVQHYISYSTHVQDYGWLSKVYDSSSSGTTGKAKRLEAITIALESQQYAGNIRYRTHIQDIGWQSWRINGAMAGTSGQSKRLEAIEITLTGQMAQHYDVYYRVHIQDYGWLGWACNGQSSGSEGLSKRLEAIQVVLVEKGAGAPGSTSNRFYKK